MEDPSEGTLERTELEECFLRLRKPIYNVVYRRLWNGQEADEVVQETFLRIWSRRERIRPSGLEPLAWRIALNLASNRRRRKRYWRWVPLPASESPGERADPEGQAATAEELVVLRTVIEALPEKFRRVILLTEFSELTYKEVGRVLGIPAGTVGSRRNRAMELLREKFDNLTRGPE